MATGFVLTLLCRDLSYVLGNAYAHLPGPQVPHTAIPGLANIPVLGPILFNQDPIVYLSILAVVAVWAYMFKTQPGLKLQGLGERPAAAYVRGVNVTLMRYVYTAIGGAWWALAAPPSLCSSSRAGPALMASKGRAGSRWRS